MRKLLFFALFVTGILGAIGFIFWEQEYKFTLPTPAPENLKQVDTGDSVWLEFTGPTTRKGMFIHFFNRDCPCSRFNITEFQSMVRRFGDEIEFMAIVQDEGNPDAAAEFAKEYNLGIKVIYDAEGTIADSLGVYSTPQAVLIKEGKIFYKGNYNRARFCVSRNTKFAEQALQALIDDEEPPYFPAVAHTAYGCELPSNQSNDSNKNWLSIF